jgi:hypothetical protein
MQSTFFLTEGGRGARRVFAQLRAIVGKDPLATLALKQRDVDRVIGPPRCFLEMTRSRSKVAMQPSPTERILRSTTPVSPHSSYSAA